MDLTTADNIIQEIASKGVTQINRLILFLENLFKYRIIYIFYRKIIYIIKCSEN